MTTINQPYTLGIWMTKTGKEKEFIAVWHAFARWTERHQPGARTGYLLQDSHDPGKFISFGPWDNTKAIAEWRERPEFGEFVANVKELCEDFQPRSLVLVASSADE